jgi:hypothetical protein
MPEEFNIVGIYTKINVNQYIEKFTCLILSHYK